MLALRIGQRVGHADIDQTRFFTARDDLDRKTQRGLGANQKLRRILGHTQGVGSHRPHLVRIEPGQSLAKAAQRHGAARLRRRIEVFLRRQPGSQPYWLLEPIERIDLPPNDAPDLKAKAVGTQIDCGNQIVSHGVAGQRPAQGIGRRPGF